MLTDNFYELERLSPHHDFDKYPDLTIHAPKCDIISETICNTSQKKIIYTLLSENVSEETEQI